MTDVDNGFKAAQKDYEKQTGEKIKRKSDFTGSVCKHGIQMPWECKECADEANADDIAAFMKAEGYPPIA